MEGGRVACRFWTEGRCLKGSRCRFAHIGEPAQRATGGPALCVYYNNGGCARGSACLYRHEGFSGAAGAQSESVAFPPRTPPVSKPGLATWIDDYDTSRAAKNAPPVSPKTVCTVCDVEMAPVKGKGRRKPPMCVPCRAEKEKEAGNALFQDENYDQATAKYSIAVRLSAFSPALLLLCNV